LSSGDRVSIPLLSQLIPDGIKPGTMLLVEFDPNSQWLAVATTIAAKYVGANGRVNYLTFTRSTESVKENLTILGVDVPAATKAGRLIIDDWYSATLTGGLIDTGPGKASLIEPIEGGLRMRSLKVTDQSVEFLKWKKEGFRSYDLVETWPPGALAIGESFTELLRFNEENPAVELCLSRWLPNERRAKRITLTGVATGIHSETLYRRLENGLDGTIELRVLERNDEVQDSLRVKSLNGQPHDTRWHRIEIKPNGEAALAG